MTKLEDIVGMEIVGYRYGVAPENGYSYNTREREYECGVSMARVGYDREINSFAIDAQSTKKYYYIGTIAGIGGDNEICLTNVRQIRRIEYLAMRKKMVEASNAIVNYTADRRIALINRGFSIGMTIEQIEEYRRAYLK